MTTNLPKVVKREIVRERKLATSNVLKKEKKPHELFSKVVSSFRWPIGRKDKLHRRKGKTEKKEQKKNKREVIEPHRFDVT